MPSLEDKIAVVDTGDAWSELILPRTYKSPYTFSRLVRTIRVPRPVSLTGTGLAL